MSFVGVNSTIQLTVPTCCFAEPTLRASGREHLTTLHIVFCPFSHTNESNTFVIWPRWVCPGQQQDPARPHPTGELRRTLRARRLACPPTADLRTEIRRRWRGGVEIARSTRREAARIITARAGDCQGIPTNATTTTLFLVIPLTTSFTVAMARSACRQQDKEVT